MVPAASTRPGPCRGDIGGLALDLDVLIGLPKLPPGWERQDIA
jgi:hypothetical protein